MRVRLAILILLGAWCALAHAQRMKHPGVLLSREQLNFIKRQVKEKKQPIYGEYQKAVTSQYAALDYKLMGPPSTGMIECGSYSRPDHGCHAEDADASAPTATRSTVTLFSSPMPSRQIAAYQSHVTTYARAWNGY